MGRFWPKHPKFSIFAIDGAFSTTAVHIKDFGPKGAF